MLKVGDKVKSLLDGKIYTVEKIDDLNKVVRLDRNIVTGKQIGRAHV